MFSAQLLIELARERHADLLCMAERERAARRLRRPHHYAVPRLALLRAFILASPDARAGS